MNILDYTYNQLTSLKKKEVTFSYLLNKKISSKEIDSSLVNPVKDALKASVNRYYFLAWEVKRYLKGVTLDETTIDYLVLSLSFYRYARNINFVEIEKMLLESLEQNKIEIDKELVSNMLKELKDNITFLPEVFNDNFIKKISLNYSYPEWIVSMMRKHFGTRNTFKSIVSSRKAFPISLCANELLVDEITNPDFEKTSTTDTSYLYVGKKKLYEEELFINRKVFVLDQSTQRVIEDLKIIQGEKILLIGNFDPSFMIKTCIGISDLGKVRAACFDYGHYLNVKNVLSKFKFRSFEAFESPLNLLCTFVQSDNNRVIVMPENSELGLVRKKPEVLLSLKKEDLDSLLEREYQTLKEASKYVTNDGELDYIVPTLNKKESYLLVRKFLSENPKFGMIEEEMIFPYQYNGEGIYFARLRKLGN
ncbi:MAG: hypothetical protein SOW55_05995 [Bacilli bacterium]|nr:hypothetical protein [Bacilli bacterium]